MGRRNKVLAITKRTADLCATQAVLYSAGFQLITATNMPVACAMIRTLPICGVIVCYHSWTEEEREAMTAALTQFYIPRMSCTGCTGCDESCGKAGILNDMLPITRLLATFGRAPSY